MMSSAVDIFPAPWRELPAEELHGKYKGVTRYQFDTYAYKGGYLYELILSVPRKPTAADVATWQAYVASLTIQ
jgi:hypothetical protein